MKNTHVLFSSIERRLGFVALLVLASFVGGAAFAQPTLSIDYQGPSALPFGGPLDPGGIYLATPGPGPLPPPALVIPSPALGIVPGGFGVPEVDALSWGRDTILRPNSAFTTWGTSYRMLISTDEFANGDPALGAGANLLTEGTAGNNEASADVEIVSLFPGQPLPPLPPGPFYGHFSVFDGNGLVPFGGPGLGLIEPNPPTPNAVPDPGDNLDAVDIRPQGPRIYFSLDALWPDPLEAPFANSGTAAANGVSPGDILASGGGGFFVVWAPAVMLGLGPQDDLDALILRENGDGIFTASVNPFDWIFGATDMVLFSVRRQSPIIGTPDAFFGIPIEEGDILTTPPGGPGTAPGIFLAAEVIGLGTVRSGTNFFFPFGDDLNALSLR